MLTGQAMSTMGKFVLLCCHFDIVFLKLLVAFFFCHPAVAFWESAGCQCQVHSGTLGAWHVVFG